GQYVADNFFLPPADPAFPGRGHHVGTSSFTNSLLIVSDDADPESVAPLRGFTTPAHWRQDLEADRVSVLTGIDAGIVNLARSLADYDARFRELTMNATRADAADGNASSAGTLDLLDLCAPMERSPA